MRRSILGLAALLWAFGITGDARALSFSLDPGDQIVDIDLSSSAQSFIYDGTTESLTVTADVDVIRLATGPDIILSPGQVSLTLSLSLLPGSLFIGSDFFGGGTMVGTYEGIAGMDFFLVDNFDGPSTILGGEIDAPGMDLVISVLGGFVANGSLGGTYTVASGAGDALFESAMGSTGSLSVQFDNLLRGGLLLTTVCSIADPVCTAPIAAGTPWPGLQDFDAQPEGVQFTPDVPEPATGSLLLLGLLGALGLRAARLG